VTPQTVRINCFNTFLKYRPIYSAEFNLMDPNSRLKTRTAVRAFQHICLIIVSWSVGFAKHKLLPSVCVVISATPALFINRMRQLAAARSQ